MRSISFTALAFLNLVGGVAYAGTIAPAVWTTPTNGTIAGVSLTVSGLSDMALLTEDLTGSGYSAAPLSNVGVIQYGASDDWTATFSEPLPNIFVYAYFWRGPYFAPGVNPPTNYTFSSPFTILSGLAGASVSGNTLTLAGTNFFDGILDFSGPITSLSVVSDAFNGSGQGMTFATTTAPEPGSLSAVLLTALLLGGLSRWQRKLNIGLKGSR